MTYAPKTRKKNYGIQNCNFLTPDLVEWMFLCLSSGRRGRKKAENESRLNHIVLCWLKEPGNPQNISKIIRMTQSFEKIPGVLEARAGVVVPSDRKVVDDSFDIGILIVVRDQDALQEYLDHPIHQKAKEETLLPLVEKVLVYDFRE